MEGTSLHFPRSDSIAQPERLSLQIGWNYPLNDHKSITLYHTHSLVHKPISLHKKIKKNPTYSECCITLHYTGNAHHITLHHT
ncbi:hypothetical protein GDO81_004082 [Engystomops pustulosus]|uniref:Uncharacterized protein n=1 Tax=Engystomops pustulosus TaxID=76066 RepID=A0AAV6ZPT8_ENGPU|nr:hypothetical protein GDO81_004082 [Engystomops pustulosus]